MLMYFTACQFLWLFYLFTVFRQRIALLRVVVKSKDALKYEQKKKRHKARPFSLAFAFFLFKAIFAAVFYKAFYYCMLEKGKLNLMSSTNNQCWICSSILL